MIRRLTILLLIVGCEEDAPIERDMNLVGTWQWFESIYHTTNDHASEEKIDTNDGDITFHYVYKFFRDGTFTYSIPGGIEGTWTTSSNTITFAKVNQDPIYGYRAETYSITDDDEYLTFLGSASGDTLYCPICQTDEDAIRSWERKFFRINSEP